MADTPAPVAAATHRRSVNKRAGSIPHERRTVVPPSTTDSAAGSTHCAARTVESASVASARRVAIQRGSTALKVIFGFIASAACRRGGAAATSSISVEYGC
eukprot:6214656-Pleurochrysis_carterae.AAC.1